MHFTVNGALQFRQRSDNVQRQIVRRHFQNCLTQFRQCNMSRSRATASSVCRELYHIADGRACVRVRVCAHAWRDKTLKPITTRVRWAAQPFNGLAESWWTNDARKLSSLGDSLVYVAFKTTAAASPRKHRIQFRISYLGQRHIHTHWYVCVLWLVYFRLSFKPNPAGVTFAYLVVIIGKPGLQELISLVLSVFHRCAVDGWHSSRHLCGIWYVDKHKRSNWCRVM